MKKTNATKRTVKSAPKKGSVTKDAVRKAIKEVASKRKSYKVNNMQKLTKHERHARILKLVRKWYQEKILGSRLFINRSGVGWTGKAVRQIDHIKIYKAYPVPFGIPEPGLGSGGADLIGITLQKGKPIFTGIEIKTGKAKLQKNQIAFRNWIKSVNGFYYVARECQTCMGTGCKWCDSKGWEFEV